MNVFDFELTSRMPIFFHKDDVEAADELEAWRKAPENRGKSRPGDDRSPPWTYMAYIHHDGEQVAIPQEVIMTALRHAGAKIVMKGQTTFKSASQSGLLILDEFCSFRGPKGEVPIEELIKHKDQPFAVHAQEAQRLGFRLDVRRATVGSSKHVRVRPRFDEWSSSGRIEILDDTIRPEVLQQMFDLAGRYSGLLDWRPSAKKSPGPYGTFTAKLKASK